MVQVIMECHPHPSPPSHLTTPDSVDDNDDGDGGSHLLRAYSVLGIVLSSLCTLYHQSYQQPLEASTVPVPVLN
jgi:hypothetical protein